MPGPEADAAVALGGLYLAIHIDGHGRMARVRPQTGPPRAPAVPCGVAGRAAALIAAWPDDPAAPGALPRAPAPTAFQQRLREALLELPAGQTVTYGALARRLGSSPRAVGAGCRANPLPLLVPCHRVVAAGGTGGYAGARAGPLAAFKAWLLERERAALETAR